MHFLSALFILREKHFKGLARLFAFILIFSLNLPAVAEEASEAEESTVPYGFIAVSQSAMTWDEAKNFCQQQGGRLPLVNDRTNLTSRDIATRMRIDGFGPTGSRWPTGLPGYRSYWTGTSGSFSPRTNRTVRPYVVEKTLLQRVRATAAQYRTTHVVCVQ